MTRENLISPRCREMFRRLEPDAAGQLVLNAALLADERAVESWRQRYRQTGLECANDGEFQLLPLVFANLRSLGYDGKEMAVLLGVHRKAWYCNQLLSRATAEAASLLARAGIPQSMVRITGGLTTIAQYYPAQRLRTVRQGELLVDGLQLQAAVRALAGDWQPRLAGREFPSEGEQRFGHSASFQRGKADQGDAGEKNAKERGEQIPNLQLDLRWRLFDPRAAVDRGSTERDFPAGISYDTREGTFLTLDAETSLIAACLQAFPHDPSSLPWVADVVMILRAAASSLDWQSVVAEAIKWGVALPTLAALAYIAECYSADIPEAVLESLANASRSAGAEAALDGLTLPFERRTLVQRVGMGMRVYARGNPDASWLMHLKRFPTFLSCYWERGRVGRRVDK